MDITKYQTVEEIMLVSGETVARMLDITKDEFDGLVNIGVFFCPAYKVGNLKRYSLNDVVVFINGCKVPEGNRYVAPTGAR